MSEELLNDHDRAVRRELVLLRLAMQRERQRRRQHYQRLAHEAKEEKQ